MNGNYRDLAENIRTRINPEGLSFTPTFNNELATLSYSDVAVFVRLAMKGVPQDYTRKCKEAGENAKNHLNKVISNVSFRFQGSVMTNTHIKGYSDIDLLTITEKFYSWDSYNSNRYLNESTLRSNLTEGQVKRLEHERNIGSYGGVALDDLKSLRLDCERILSSKYLVCDISNAKAITINNQNLNRKVDISIANWYNDVKSIINNKGDYQGIQIYNKDNHSKEEADFPFLSIKRINERGDSTDSRLRKMIRLLKNVKALSHLDIDLSSFDINAICYDIPTWKYQTAAFLELVPIIYDHLRGICTDAGHSNRLCSVDDREYIFRGRANKLENVRIMLNEVEKINIDLKR